MGFQAASGAYVTAQNSSSFQLGNGEYFANAGSDTTKPVLSSPNSSSVLDTTFNALVTTDTGEGTVYVVATPTITAPSALQVAAGTDHNDVSRLNKNQAVTVSGAQTLAVTGATASTGYYLHFTHKDNANNYADVVTSSLITTLAPQVTVTDVNTTERVVESATITITGTNFGTVIGDVTVELVSGSYTDQAVVTACSDTSITCTITQPLTSAVPFEDSNNSVSLKVTRTGHGNATIALDDYNPPAGYDAYSLSLADTDVTEYSVLQLAGAVNGDQFVAPSTYSGGTLSWQTSNGNATGTFIETGFGNGSFIIRFWRASTGQVFLSTVTLTDGAITYTSQLFRTISKRVFTTICRDEVR